jgi:hypothetical protein
MRVLPERCALRRECWIVFVCVFYFIRYWAEPDTSPTVDMCDLGRGIVDCRRSLLCPGGVSHWTLGPRHTPVAGTYYHCLAGRSPAPDAARSGSPTEAQEVPGSNTRGRMIFIKSPDMIPGNFIFIYFMKFTGIYRKFLLFTLYEAGWPVLYVWCSRHV